MGTKKKIDNFMKEVNNEKDWENLFEYQVRLKIKKALQYLINSSLFNIFQSVSTRASAVPFLVIND